MKVLGNFFVLNTIFFFFFAFQTNAQNSVLDDHFKDYEVVTFDSRALKSYSEQRRNDFIRLPFALSKKYKWNLELLSEEIFSDAFRQQNGSASRSFDEISLPMVLKGYGQNSNNIRATITVNDDFLYGRVVTDTDAIYFEPLKTFDKNAKANQIVVYKESDVIEKDYGTCASDQIERELEKLQLRTIDEKTSLRSAGSCKQVDLAVANDHTIFELQGSNVTNFNAGVIANVNSDYDDVFNNEVRFVIVETYIAQNSSQNAWGFTTDANELLNNFRNWAGSGFSATHDLGELWTASDLTFQGNSSTIGLASKPGVCGSFRYHVLENYSSNAAGLRNLVSHEIGHNFNLGHVSESSRIMSGSVSGTNVWSQTSISDLNSYLTQITCLGECTGTPPDGGGGTPPVADFDATLLQECNPTQVRLNDLSSNSPTSWSWQIENGSPSTSNAQNPVVELPGGGSYRVTLTATNNAGSDVKILLMNLNNIGSPPAAAFTFAISGNAVSFDNNTTNGLTYSWNFGDGATSVTANPNHTYSSPGTYTVVLTSNNDCGTDTESKTVTISDQIAAAFAASSTEICEGESITFTNQSSSNVETFAWEFENGTPSTSTSENPTVVFNNGGSFNVRLTVSGGGTSDSENKVGYITVNEIPNTSFTETIDGYSVIFDNNTLSGFTYNWQFGDGTSSSSANPTHNYVEAGSYTVTLTSNNDCGSDQFVRTITIADQVTADFTVNQTSGCSSQEFIFSNASTGNVTSYFWEFQDGIPATSTEENPSVTFSSTGTKTIRLTVSNSLYEDSENKLNFIDIVDAPSVNFTFSINENTVVFDNNTTGGFFYNWDFGDGQTSTTPNPSHTYDAPGDYIVTLTSNNDCETSNIEKIVSIEGSITANFTASAAEICLGGSVQFTNFSEGPITGYLWEFQGGIPATSTEANPSVRYASTGTFDVKLTVTDGSTEDINLKGGLITVKDSPVVGFNYNKNGYVVDFVNLSSDGETYTWNFGDNEFSSSFAPQHTYAQPGSFEVILEATNSCGTNEVSKTLTIEEIVEADFVFNPSSICEGETVNFTSAAIGNIQSYFWEFEGGTPATSTQENPLVTYHSSGDHAAKLTVTGQFGAQNSKTISSAISVAARPEANFAYVVEEKTLILNNLSKNSDSFIWNFGDGSTSFDESPVHTYLEEGNYLVTLQTSGPCGSDEFQVEIPVFDILLANFQVSDTTLCPGQELVLQDLSSGNPTQWEWSIMGEQMISAEEQNPVVVLEEPGIYTVELIVRNETEEDSKVFHQYIEVMPLPEVSFTFEQLDLVLNFSNVSQNGKSYYWDFGDGTSSNESNPSHEYKEEGNYLVMLRVENECSTIESEQEVGVFNQLTAGFNAETTEICESTSIQFYNQSSGGATSWSWSFPGGSPSTSSEKNPIVKYEKTGVYDVILKVNRESEEVVETKSNFVKVNKLPVSNFEYQVDKNVVQFFNKSTNGKSFEWNFDSKELNPIVEFEEEKAYEISLITKNSCASDTASQIVDLYEEAKTYANFSISANSYCLGDEISFVDLSSEDVTEWKWSFPGATPSESSEKNPMVMYESFGTYNVELTVSNGFNTRTIMLEDYVQIVEKPTAAFTIKQTNNFIAINNLSKHATNVVYHIDGVKYNEDLPYFTFPKNGVFEVRQVVRNSCGESMATETVEVNVYPSAGFSVDIVQGCTPLVVNFESRSTDNADEVKWILEGSESPEIKGFAPSVTYKQPGNYGIKVIARNQFGADTIELNSLIEVYDQPKASFEYKIEGLSVEFITTSEAYDSVKWDLGDGTLSSEIAFSHEYRSGTLYPIILQVFKGECTDILTDEIDLRSTGIEESDLSSLVKIYPNPANSYLNIQFEGNIGVVEKIVLIDQLGQQILQRSATAGSSSIVLRNLDSMPPGQYFVAVYVKDAASIFKKLIIIR